MILDVLFLIGGVALVGWGVVAVISASWSWQLNEAINRLFRSKQVDEPAENWPVQSRRLGAAAIVIGVINIALSIASLT